MKKMITIIAVLLIVMSSCEIEPVERFGFDTQVEVNSRGNTIFYVSGSPVTIRLSGTISAVQGTIQAELISPSGRIVCLEAVMAPDTIRIGRTFIAEPGFWKLRYSSTNGKGRIVLHAALRN